MARRGGRRGGKRTITPERRAERWREAAAFLRRAGSLPAARRLAASERHPGFDTSVWITALGKMLGGKL